MTDARKRTEEIVDAFIVKQDTINPDGSSCEDYDRDLIWPIAAAMEAEFARGQAVAQEAMKDRLRHCYSKCQATAFLDSLPDPGMALVPREPPICDDEVRIIRQQTIYGGSVPEGIRDRSGYLFFFRIPNRYQGQDERYARDVAQMNALADYLLKCMLSAAEGGKK